MADAIACGGPISCCLHAKEAANVELPLDPPAALLNVTLSSDDLQPFLFSPQMTVDDVHKRYDKLAGRLRAAEFIYHTLLTRAAELRKTIGNEPAPTTTFTLKDRMSPSCEPSTSSPISHSKPTSKLHDASFSYDSLPTPIPTPSTVPSPTSFPFKPSPANSPELSSSSTDWTQRCTAYYAKRKLQEEAMKARQEGHNNTSSRQSSFRGSNVHSHPQSNSSRTQPQGSYPQPQQHERGRTRDQMRKAAIVVAAWNAYTQGWDLITNTLGKNASELNTPSSPAPGAGAGAPLLPPFLSMSSIPWPVLRTPLDGEVNPWDVTPEDIHEFILSPYHSPNKPKEVRIREAYLRWHPDKASKWMASVILSDRVRVKQTVDRVAWCLNQLK